MRSSDRWRLFLGLLPALRHRLPSLPCRASEQYLDPGRWSVMSRPQVRHLRTPVAIACGHCFSIVLCNGTGVAAAPTSAGSLGERVLFGVRDSANLAQFSFSDG